MRIPLSTDLKTRTGVPDKDARLKNSYIETRGDQNVVRKRPIAQGGVSVGTGIAQGGINFNGLFLMNGDVLSPYTGGGTNWNSGTTYNVGDMVSLGFVDYWAINSNTNSQPPNANWSTTYVPSVPLLPGWTLGTIASYPASYGSPIAWNGTVYCYIDTFSTTSYTSSDGLVWTSHTDANLTGSGVWNICWNGTFFCAVDGGGTSVISTNGISWTKYSSLVLSGATDIVWNGTVFCCSANSFSYTSIDGINWTQHALPAGMTDIRTITWNGTVFCVVARNTTIAATSTDGSTWNPQVLPASSSWIKVKAVGTLLIAVANGGANTAYSTNNGVTWNSGGIISVSGNCCVSTNGSILLVTRAVNSSTYYTTTDGITYTSRTLPSIKTWQATAYGNKFVVMDVTTICATSATGT